MCGPATITRNSVAATFGGAGILLALFFAAPAAPAQDSDFHPIYVVLQNPRCSNCHTDTDGPLQRDGRPHQPPVKRGADGRGIGALACARCHGKTNTASAPGAPDWRMPESGMAVFRNRSEAALCRQLRDPAGNGGLDFDHLGSHVADDPLIGWAWSPGALRKSPAQARDALVAALTAWLRAGAPCP